MANEVLIETLWNVKGKRSSGPRKRKPSFNRNIVECKETKKTVRDQFVKF